MGNGKNISVYLDAETLELLDAAVRERAKADRAAGKTGYSVTNRSSYISYAIVNLSEPSPNQPALSIPLIRDIVSPIAKRFHVERVSLFGSFARGEQTDASDVDLFIEKGGLKGMEVFDFQNCLEKALGREVDIVTSEGAGARILKRVEAEAVAIYAA